MTEKNGKSYATPKELQKTKQELLDKIDTRVAKEDFCGEPNSFRVEMHRRFDQMDEKFTMVFAALDRLSGQIREFLTEKWAGE